MLRAPVPLLEEAAEMLPGAWLADIVHTRELVRMDPARGHVQFVPTGNSFYGPFYRRAHPGSRLGDEQAGNKLEALSWRLLEGGHGRLLADLQTLAARHRLAGEAFARLPAMALRLRTAPAVSARGRSRSRGSL
jgi:hypothetical protein